MTRTELPVPVDEWEHFGSAVHFNFARMCRWHMATRVGPWLVSSIGGFDPPQKGQRLISDRILFPDNPLADDHTREDWLARYGSPYVPVISPVRNTIAMFETLVFRCSVVTVEGITVPDYCTDPACSCLGIPHLPLGTDGIQIDELIANTPLAAQRNHVQLCHKWAEIPADAELQPMADRWTDIPDGHVMRCAAWLVTMIASESGDMTDLIRLLKDGFDK